MNRMETAVQDYKNSRKNERETINVILETVFNNRAFFCLEKLNEDCFSDFLLYLEERLSRFLNLYDPKIGKFSTYLRKICTTLLRSWYRSFYRSYAREIALNTYFYEEYLSETEADDIDEEFLCTPPSEELCTFLSEISKKIPLQTKLVMLALKSSTFLTDRHIHKICELAGISQDELTEKLDQINRALSKKLERQKHLIQLQNQAYIIRKQNAVQMSILNPESSHYRNAEISLEYHDGVWKSRMERSRKTHDVYPTNQAISDVLDIPLGQVTHVFSAIHHKMDDLNNGKDVSCEHDSIRSHRKRSQKKRASGNSETPHNKDPKR